MGAADRYGTGTHLCGTALHTRGVGDMGPATTIEVMLYLAAALQVAAAVVALTIIPIMTRDAHTSWFVSWLIMCAALVLQAYRRIVEVNQQGGLLNAVTALAVSVLLLAGITGIRAAFVWLHRARLLLDKEVQRSGQLAVELEHLATHDELTGLPNRRLFEAETERAATFAKRGTVSTILFTDVDQFKTCNDVLGHAVGDQVLHEIAQGMKDVVRETDTVARIGGDEFGVVLWGQTGEAVVDISQRLSEAVVAIGLEHGLDIGLSIGAAALTPGTDASSVLAEADRRMYEAKASP
jgi:diguanylate cyclase (GGDEF)-like protein